MIDFLTHNYDVYISGFLGFSFLFTFTKEEYLGTCFNKTLNIFLTFISCQVIAIFSYLLCIECFDVTNTLAFVISGICASNPLLWRDIILFIGDFIKYFFKEAKEPLTDFIIKACRKRLHMNVTSFKNKDK